VIRLYILIELLPWVDLFFASLTLLKRVEKRSRHAIMFPEGARTLGRDKNYALPANKPGPTGIPLIIICISFTSITPSAAP